MDTKHTPGPWKVYHEYNVMKDNRSIANCGGHTVNTPNWQEIDDQNKANARLVAAAPALLEALGNLVDYCDRTLFSHVHITQEPAEMKAARAAIAAAGGEKQ